MTDDEKFQTAMARHKAGDIAGALSLYRDLLTRYPGHPRLNSLMGSAELSQGHADMAVTLLRRALEADPHQPDAACNLAIALQARHQLTDALAAIDHCLTRFADMAEAHDRRGAILAEMRRTEEALAAYHSAARLAPRAPQARYRAGIMALELKRYDEALTCFDQTIALAPKFVEAHTNRATCLQMMGRKSDALRGFDDVVALAPDFAIAHYNRGNLLKEMMRLTDALASLQRARTLDPTLAQAYWNEGLVRLLCGDFAEGWPLYEWRWKNPELTHPDWLKTTPLWRGEPLAKRTLIIRTDQGYGDYIQFCRFAITAGAQGAHVILSAPDALCRLLRSMKDVDVIADGMPLPQGALHVPVLSLPQLFGVTETSIPPAPYLAADDSLRENIRAALGPKTRPRIGLAISGNAAHKNDTNRSVPLATLAPLLDLPCDFYLVQQGLRPDDATEATRWPNLHQPALTDFADTAALIAEMDLTISVDSAPAHVAGAIGAPVWILLPFSPDWRWRVDRQDCPWYPTARLFRQPEICDWNSVILTLLPALTALTAPLFT